METVILILVISLLMGLAASGWIFLLFAFYTKENNDENLKEHLEKIEQILSK